MNPDPTKTCPRCGRPLSAHEGTDGDAPACCAEVPVDPHEDAAWWSSFGDLRELQALADRLAHLGDAGVTPWGFTLEAPDGRALLRVGQGGPDTFHVALLLPPGFGEKAAKKRAERGLLWFEREAAAAWRARGFVRPTQGEPLRLVVEGARRWAVGVDVRFSTAGDDLVARLEWARDNGVLAFEGEG